MNLLETTSTLSTDLYQKVVMFHASLLTANQLPEIAIGHNYPGAIAGGLVTSLLGAVLGHGAGNLLSGIQNQSLPTNIEWQSPDGRPTETARRAERDTLRAGQYKTAGAIIGGILGFATGGYFGSQF